MSRSYINQTQDDTIFEDALNNSFVYNPNSNTAPSFAPSSHPLKKLPNAIDVQFNQHNNTSEPIFTREQISGAESSTFTESDVAQFRLQQVKLSLAASKLAIPPTDSRGSETSKSQPIYYKPPSSNIRDTQFGIKSFLPPNVAISGTRKDTKNRIPLYINSSLPNPPQPVVSDIIAGLKAEKRTDIQEDDLEDDVESGPSGQWTNPIMKQALGRQVNKEYQTKKLLSNLLYLVAFNFLKALLTKGVELYEARQQSQLQSQYQFQHIHNSENEDSWDLVLLILIASRIISGVFILNIVIASIKLLKGQDQCYDLPLSDKQRRLIGLRVRYERDTGEIERIPERDLTEEQDAELVLKQRRYQAKGQGGKEKYALPKYSKLNKYAHYDFNKGSVLLNEQADLKLSNPAISRFIGKSPAVTPISKKPVLSQAEREEFSRNFNLKFETR